MHCDKTKMFINCSESHTQSQPFRPLPCDDCHIYMLSLRLQDCFIRNFKCNNAGLKCINICSGRGGRTCNNSDLIGDVVWVQPFPVLHVRNVLCLTLTVSLNLISIPSPSGLLLYHGVAVIIIILKHYYIYIYVMIVTVIAWQKPARLDSGMRFKEIDMVNWNIYILSQCIYCQVSNIRRTLVSN